MYRLGNGVEKNYLLGLEWHAKADEQDHLGAQARLGNTYYWGKPFNGIPQNLVAAKKWLLLAAEQGVVKANPPSESCMTELRAQRRTK